MTVTTISSKLAMNGLQQRLYAQQATVEEMCNRYGDTCWGDGDCCYGLVCEWFHCAWA